MTGGGSTSLWISTVLTLEDGQSSFCPSTVVSLFLPAGAGLFCLRVGFILCQLLLLLLLVRVFRWIADIEEEGREATCSHLNDTVKDAVEETKVMRVGNAQ